MPVYEFHCINCNKRFEELCRSFSEADSVSCPECENPKVERLMSVFAMASGSARNNEQYFSSKSSCASCSATSCRTCSK
ncbi:zinc ribbon domain-containing protein [Candidatus Poribacteria bacterium]|nr:zinc ribbon domain-containing protein [Candidatus Poribacteria bacterium]